MDPELGYPAYYGDTMETPLTSTSRLPSDVETDHSQSYQMGPILQQMLEEFRMGDEILKKDNKKFSIRLGRSKSWQQLQDIAQYSSLITESNAIHAMSSLM